MMKDSIPLHLDTYCSAIQNTLEVFGFTSRDHIQVLPTVDVNVACDLSAHLFNNVGVESTTDLRLVSIADLDSLKPIQARKLLEQWQVTSAPSTPPTPSTPTSSRQPPSRCSTPTTPHSASFSNSSPVASRGSSPFVDYNWVQTYDIPWSSFSRNLMRDLNENRKPRLALRREMVRQIVEDTMSVCPGPRPLKRQLEMIARRIVQKYPKSFKDEIEGKVVGSGYDSLWKQLINKSENCYRKIEHTPRKRPAPRDSSASFADDLEEARLQKMDTYGCINFNPTELPDGETEESLLAMKNTMKDSCNMSSVDVDSCMQKTFILQRRDILNPEMCVPDLKKDWPYLFNKAGMAINFLQLVGLNIEHELTGSITERLPAILKYLDNEGGKKIQRHLVYIEAAEKELENTAPRIPGTLVALMEHFGEKLETLVLEKDSTTTKQDVQGNLPQTPILISCGSILTATRFMLAIDGCVVNEYIGAFPTALMMLFAAFFCLNVQYPEGAAATLDFIQRSLVGINPDKGCKTNAKKKKVPTATLR